MLALAIAAAAVVAGVAVNQILDNGELSFTWAYLAFGFTLLGALVATYATQPLSPSGERMPWLPLRAYRRQLRASVARMETLGVLTRGAYVLRMRQIYVDLALRPRALHDTAGDTGVVPSAPYGESEVPRRAALNDFLPLNQVFAVIGSPGCGKTTLIRHQALMMCEKRWRLWPRRELPVLLYLRDHWADLVGERPGELAEVAVKAGWLNKKIPAWWLARQLDRRTCVVLLDGLDEVADEEQRKRVVAWVETQIRRYPGCTFVITSRPLGYLSNPLPDAEVLQVQRFTRDQISRFLHGWYYAIEHRARFDPEVDGDLPETPSDIERIAAEKAEDLLGRLRGEPALHELAVNPLLLTMIANVHLYRGALPGKRADLYAEMCDVLLHHRLAARNLADLTGLTGKQKGIVLRQLAIHMMLWAARDISAPDARMVIEKPLAAVSGDDRLTAQVFLAEIVKSGLLVEREHGQYAFAHLTLQEYLAAAYIREHPEHFSILVSNVDNPWWRETTLLWVADGDATEIVEACLAAETPRTLSLAFDCARDNPRQLRPDVRARLNDLLNTSQFAAQSPEKRRMIASVAAARALREVAWLEDGTAVCARPVSRDLWNLFVIEERARGRHLMAQPDGADLPAVGVWADDATRFVDWLNGLSDGGPEYRLPTPDEAARISPEMVTDLGDQTMWCQDGEHMRLHQPAGASWPYVASGSAFPSFARTAGLYVWAFNVLIYQAGTPGNLLRLLAYLHILATRPHSSLGRFLLALDLDDLVAHAGAENYGYDAVRELLNNFDFDPHSGNVAPDQLTRVHTQREVSRLAEPLKAELTFTWEILLDLLSRADFTVFDRNASVVPNARTLADALHQVLDLELDRIRDRLLDGHLEKDRSIRLLLLELVSDVPKTSAQLGDDKRDQALVTALLITNLHIRGFREHLSQAAESTSPVGDDLDVLENALERVVQTRPREFARVNSTRLEAHTLERRTARDIARVIAVMLTKFPAYQSDSVPVWRLAAFMYSAGKLGASHAAAARPVFNRGRVSLPRNSEEHIRQRFLTQGNAAADPVGALRTAASELHTDDHSDLISRLLVLNALGLIEPIMNRSVPVDEVDLVEAGVSVMAALELIKQTGHAGLAAPLSKVLNRVVAMAYPDVDQPPPNEVLVLARNF